MSRGESALFTIPIASGGQVKCTSPAHKVYVVEFTAPPDNRLKSDFCQAILLALDIIELKHTPGVVITTSGIPKFFSNGLDLDHAFTTPDFFPNNLYPLWRRVLTYPMPTIALLNGHAFAGGFMFAMMHDYRIMNAQKGYLCLNEVELGVPLQPAMSSIFRQKVSATVYRTLVLEGKRYKSTEALKDGIVDGLGGLEEALKYVDELNLTTKADKGVYGDLKREMWRETVKYLETYAEETARLGKDGEVSQEEDADRKNRVEKWATKAKL